MDDDYLDELLDAQFQRRHHRRAMNAELGNPEFETDEEGDPDE